jgi:U3 small nucleolar RNA-associated protein 7
MFVGGGIDDVGFYKGYMYTAEEDIKIWDTRMLKLLYRCPLERKATSIELSQSGLLAINYGYKITVFKDTHLNKQTHPYMIYQSHGHINNCQFVPFEDIMGLGKTNGFSSISIPGSGIPYYDSF